MFDDLNLFNLEAVGQSSINNHSPKLKALRKSNKARNRTQFMGDTTSGVVLPPICSI